MYQVIINWLTPHLQLQVMVHPILKAEEREAAKDARNQGNALARYNQAKEIMQEEEGRGQQEEEEGRTWAIKRPTTYVESKEDKDAEGEEGENEVGEWEDKGQEQEDEDEQADKRSHKLGLDKLKDQPVDNRLKTDLDKEDVYTPGHSGKPQDLPIKAPREPKARKPAVVKAEKANKGIGGKVRLAKAVATVAEAKAKAARAEAETAKAEAKAARAEVKAARAQAKAFRAEAKAAGSSCGSETVLPPPEVEKGKGKGQVKEGGEEPKTKKKQKGGKAKPPAPAGPVRTSLGCAVKERPPCL